MSKSVFKKTGISIEKEIKILKIEKKFSNMWCSLKRLVLQTGNKFNELKNGYEVKISEPDFNLYNIVKKFKPNIIFNVTDNLEDAYIKHFREPSSAIYSFWSKRVCSGNE